MLSITRYMVKNKNLSPWIKFIWTFEAENANIHNKLLPTDCIDVIINLSSKMIYETNIEKITAPPVHINGLRDRHSYIYQTGIIRVIGIAFYPFGLFPFVQKSLAGIQNKIVDLSELSDSLAQQLNTVICGGLATDEIVNRIENILLSELSIPADYPKKAALMNDFINAEECVTVKTFCARHGIEIKTFERMFLRYTGYNPQILRRIRRFQNVSNQIAGSSSDISFSSVAYDSNYADQSHLIKEFKRFSGTSPQLFQQKKDTVKGNAVYVYV